VITLGIDVGTTHTKVLARDAVSGEALAVETAATPIVRDDAGDAHAPAEVLHVVEQLLTAVAASLGDADRVAALGVASVGEEVVLLDEAQQPTADALAWYDPRGRDEAAAFLDGPGAGLDLVQRWRHDPTFSLFKLLWLREHEPEHYARAVTWTDLGDFVLASLGADVVMDWTHASRAGAFDLQRHAWDLETVAAAGLQITFPRLEPSGAVAGRLRPEAARRLGLPAGVVLVTGGHDHLCAAYAADLQPGDLFLSAGTSEAHLLPLERPIVGDPGRYHLDQGCYVDRERYYAHVNILSGRLYQYWRGRLYPDADDAAVDAELAAVDLAALDLRFVVSDDGHNGHFEGAEAAGRAERMLAVHVGLADRSADVVAFLEAAAGRSVGRVIAVGHPPQQPLWRELRRRRYDRPLEVRTQPEMAAEGAARLAADAIASPT
jgi:xylulokinase